MMWHLSSLQSLTLSEGDSSCPGRFQAPDSPLPSLSGAEGGEWDPGYQACQPLAGASQQDPSKANKGASNSLEIFLYKGIHCGEDTNGVETVWGLGKRWLPGASQVY